MEYRLEQAGTPFLARLGFGQLKLLLFDRQRPEIAGRIPGILRNRPATGLAHAAGISAGEALTMQKTSQASLIEHGQGEDAKFFSRDRFPESAVRCQKQTIPTSVQWKTAHHSGAGARGISLRRRSI